MPIHSFYTEAAKGLGRNRRDATRRDAWAGGGGPTWIRKTQAKEESEKEEEKEKADSRENYRFGCTALKSASSPLTGGIEFFPDAESSWHRVRTAPPFPLVPLTLFRAQPTPGFPLLSSSPFPSPSHQPQPARHHPLVSRGQQFRSRDGELPIATARRDGGARTPQPRWN